VTTAQAESECGTHCEGIEVALGAPDGKHQAGAESRYDFNLFVVLPIIGKIESSKEVLIPDFLSSRLLDWQRRSYEVHAFFHCMDSFLWEAAHSRKYRLISV